MMGCGLKKVGNLLAELDSRKGIGLITRIRQGLGRPDRIYVRKCTQQDMYKRNIQTRQNNISGNAKMTGTDMSEMPGNDTEDNKTEISDTDRSDTEYLSFYSEESEEMHRKRMEREVYHQMILNNIGYEYLVDVYNRDMLNEIVELIVDTVCSEQEMIRIGGDRKPIITEEEYEVASASIMFMTKPEYRGAKDFLLKGKVRCGNCHRSLAYTDGGIHPKIYCPHKAQAGRYSHCPEDAYPVSVIEGHIWYSLKRILRILDSVQRESEEKYTDNSFTGKRQQRVLESELEKLKNERIHQYEAYAEGVLSREKYITVKKQLTEKIEKIQSEQKALASVIIEEERYRSRIRTAVQQLGGQIERGKLTKEIIDTMIDTVYVYDKKRIEVILRFDDVLQKVISEYMEGAKGA